MKASIPRADFDKSKATEDYGLFQLGSSITNDTRCTWN